LWVSAGRHFQCSRLCFELSGSALASPLPAELAIEDAHAQIAGTATDARPMNARAYKAKKRRSEEEA
jgi:hypothetical protein